MATSTQKGRKRTTFQVVAQPGSQVSVCGTFNDWDPARYPMKDNPTNGVFKANILLPKGKHEYKFVVDGEWLTDPDCGDQAPNECGSMNSVIVV